jgi:hypothetical protein
VNLRRLSNRHRPPWRAGAVLNRRTPDGSAAMHPTRERRFVRPAPTPWRGTFGSAQQRPGALQSQLRGDCASQADQHPPPPQFERRFADAHSRSRARGALF